MKNHIFFLILFTSPLILVLLVFFMLFVASVSPFILIAYIYQLNKKSRLNQTKSNFDDIDLILKAKRTIERHKKQNLN